MRVAGVLLVATLTLVLALAGLASASDRSRVVAAINGYDQAVAARDARAACAFLSRRAKKVIGGKSCPATLREGFDFLSDEVLEAFAHCEVSHVRVNGLRARARVDCPSPEIPPQSQLLVFERGAWKLREAGA